MSKHTPGIWRIAALRDGAHHIIGTEFKDSVAVTCMPFGGREAREANANLIAAAPELIAALKALAERYEQLLIETRITKRDLKWMQENVHFYTEDERALIARAEGRP